MRINEMTPNITLSQPVYNPEAGAFEARAVLQDGVEFTYAVQFKATPYAEFGQIARGLKAHALALHQRDRARTQRFIRDTVRAATKRANAPGFGTFLAA